MADRWRLQIEERNLFIDHKEIVSSVLQIQERVGLFITTGQAACMKELV